MTTDLVPVQTRMLPEYYDVIKEYAKMHNRSISREIVQLIEEALELRHKTTHEFAKPKRKKP
jgi:hypothetical protein